MFNPADAHIVVCDPERLPGPEAVVRVADCTRMIVKALWKGEHHALLLQVRLKDNARAAKPGVWPAAAHPADLELQLAVRPQCTPGYKPSTTCDGGAIPTAKSAPHTGKRGCRQTRSAMPSGVSGPRPRHEPSMRRARPARWCHTRFHWRTCPSNQPGRAPSGSRVPFPLARGATEPTKCPLCADKYYTSGAMLEHPAWHALHAAAPVDDKEAASNILQGRAQRAPWQAPYARRPPPQAADHADGDEEAPRAAPGTGGAAQQVFIPAGLAPLAPLWAPLGAGSPHPMAPAHPGALAAPADPAAMPMRDG